MDRKRKRFLVLQMIRLRQAGSYNIFSGRQSKPRSSRTHFFQTRPLEEYSDVLHKS